MYIFYQQHTLTLYISCHIISHVIFLYIRCHVSLTKLNLWVFLADSRYRNRTSRSNSFFPRAKTDSRLPPPPSSFSLGKKTLWKPFGLRASFPRDEFPVSKALIYQQPDGCWRLVCPNTSFLFRTCPTIIVQKSTGLFHHCLQAKFKSPPNKSSNFQSSRRRDVSMKQFRRHCICGISCNGVNTLIILKSLFLVRGRVWCRMI